MDLFAGPSIHRIQVRAFSTTTYPENFHMVSISIFPIVSLNLIEQLNEIDVIQSRKLKL